jgi:hypothetical protein
MSIISAFAAAGNTVTLNTNVAANTSQSCPVDLSDFGLTQMPQALRMLNNGTADIWVYISGATQTAAFPTAGTTDAGTPQPGFRLKPGIREVFTLNAGSPNVEGLQPPVPGFWVNTISSVASQPLDITPGEGV